MFVHYLLAAFSFAVTFIVLKSLPWALTAAFVSVFLDADHVCDFWLGSGFSLNPKKFIKETLNSSPYFERSGKTLIPFHSWELLALFLVVTTVLDTSQVYFAFVVGFVPHLLWDQITFAKNPWMYFFTYRLTKGFDYTKFCHG